MKLCRLLRCGTIELQGIHVESVHKTFRGRALRLMGVSLPVMREKSVKALDGISLTVAPGEAVGVIGPNGAGKTTLMGCLLGFIYPDSGKVEIEGRNPNSSVVRRLIGYVPERLNFQEYFTMLEFLKFHYQLAGLPAGKQNSRIEELLSLVRLDKSKWTLPVGKCSRGMLQRLAIAQAMIAEPRYLFLDEPTSGIDPGGVLELTSVLMDVRNQGITLVLNSHQLDQVQKICERMVFVQHGRAVNTDLLEQMNSIGRAVILRFQRTIEPDMLLKLEQVAVDLGLTLQNTWNENAEFLVDGDDDNVRLLKAIVQKDLPLVEVVPKHNKLERMFMGSNDVTKPAGVS